MKNLSKLLASLYYYLGILYDKLELSIFKRERQKEEPDEKVYQKTYGSCYVCSNDRLYDSSTTWAGENTDEMSVIRVMGINNTVTTVNGGTVSLKDWIESGNSQLYNTFTEELAKRNIKLEFNLIEDDQYTTVCQTTVASGNLGCDIMYIEPLDDKTKQRLIDRGIFVPINEIWDQSEEGTAKESSLREKESLFPSV